jgi:hypothetical protein
MKRIANAEYCEIIIPASNSRSQFFFPDLPNLRGRKLDAMEFYSNQEISITNSGYTPVSVTDVPKVSVTLYYNSGEYVVMPLARFRRLQLSGENQYYESAGSATPQYTAVQLDGTLFDGQVIVWTKSYITINSNTSNFSSESFAFNIYYR